jgi:CRISPR/Cas system-associated exonuclease Cas4 (RecB family)
MIVYEVLRDCSISYTDRGEDHGGFVLYKGDYFFIEPDFAWIKKESISIYETTYYNKKSLLKSIYHNKLVSFNDKTKDIKYEWTWIRDINIIDPIIRMELINGTSGFEKDFDKLVYWNTTTGQPVLKDVTQQWEREIKINEIINI